MIYLVIFSLVDARVFFFILAGGAAISFLITLVMLDEPEGAFSEHIHDEPSLQEQH